MRLPCFVPLLILALGLVGGGCQKLSSSGPLYDKSMEVDATDFNEVNIGAPKKDQKVSVTATSNAGNVSVFVVLDKDLAAAKSQLEQQQPFTVPALGKKEKTKEVALEVIVPSGQDFTVLIANNSGKKTSVAVKILNVQ